MRMVMNEIEGHENTRTFALLQASRDSEYVKKLYGGYLNVFVDAFGDEGERWDLYRVVEGDFPAIDELEKYEAFVISGSPYDAYGDDDWILELCLLLQTIFSMQKKVLGVCFGHQILCRALGGKVAKSDSGWDIGVRKVTFSKEILPFSIDSYKLDKIPSSLSIIECHQDEVWEVPKGAEVIAYSEKTSVEMFSFGKHVLGIQGHPEYSKDILNHLIDRLLSMNSIEEGFAEDVKSNLFVSDPDSKYWEKICKSFLKAR